MAFKTPDERDADYELAQHRPPERRFLRQLLDQLRYPNASLVVRLRAIKPWWQSLSAKDSVTINQSFYNSKVAVVALWEKGTLRPDIVRLLKLLRAEGVYIVGVNTAKLDEDSAHRSLFDTYIERVNFGRDFGSYRTGVLHLASQSELGQVPRLLLLNDSVYYLENETPKFLKQMLTSDVDVLGATENFEIYRHLGSFAVSVGGRALAHPAFLKFWRRYRLSEIRPKVIRRGEMKLTRVLERCASSPSSFSALYTVKSVSEFLASDRANIDVALSLTAHARTHWRKLTMRQVLEAWRQRHLFTSAPNSHYQRLTNTANLTEVMGTPTTLATAVKEMRRLYPAVDRKTLESELHDLTVGAVLLTCASGSQVHQNGLLFHELGCPLVKIDAIYRGAWSYEDAEKLLAKVSDSDRETLGALLYARAYGEDALRGWRRAAFMRGLI